MYAIIETGGKQYRVEEGDVIDIELVTAGDENEVKFKALFLNTGNAVKIGTPNIEGYEVVGEFLQEVKGPKVINFKYKKRKNYRRKVGHRQTYSRVKIKAIKGTGHGS